MIRQIWPFNVQCFPHIFSEELPFVVNLRTLSSAWIKLESMSQTARPWEFIPTRCLSFLKWSFIYSANPYLGNSACAFIVFQIMYCRSSPRSIIINLQTADRYSQHFQTKEWFQMINLSSICLSIYPSIQQAMYSICNIAMKSPHALRQAYSCVLLNFQ